MQFSLSRERNAVEQLLRRAHQEFDALGFIPTLTGAQLMAQGIDVPALENRLETAVWR